MADIPFSKIHIRPNHPDFLDLPWDQPLSSWHQVCSRIVTLEKGESRHEVLFVSYDNRVYAIKELPARFGEQEYRILGELEKRDLPCVRPVGYVHLGTKDEKSIVITEYLEYSIPYRSLFLKSGLKKYQEHLMDALAILFVRLHLNGIFWGDCSLSNILFRRDAGKLQAYLVDAETSRSYSSLSEGQRNHDIMIAEENIFGELWDLEAMSILDEDISIPQVGSCIRTKYENLWQEIQSEDSLDSDQSYRIQERIRRINELGFSVDEVEIVRAGDSNQVKVKLMVTDKNYHREQLQKWTGIHAEENQARLILNEIHELKSQLSEAQQRSLPISSAAFHWIYEIYFPTIRDLGLMYNNETAPEIYCDVLEHKWHLSVQAGHDVGREKAVNDFRKNHFQLQNTVQRVGSTSI